MSLFQKKTYIWFAYILSMYISSANIAQKLKIGVVKFPQSAFQ